MTDTTRKQRCLGIVFSLLALMLWVPQYSNGQSRNADGSTGAIIELTAAERETLEGLLGRDVIGRSVPARALDEPTKYFPLQEYVREFLVVSGEETGKKIKHVFQPVEQGHSEAQWRYAIGEKYTAYVGISDDGSISLVTDTDQNSGVISRYTPVEPVLLAGLRPGESKYSKIDVAVYDLDEPTKLTHTGELDLAYTYVGAYEITVPAGTYQAVLIRSIYEGKVGPADVKDVQYRFFAENVGEVARIDHTDIAAFLIYQNQSKTGKVLIDRN